jgi:hypothetical protein
MGGTLMRTVVTVLAVIGLGWVVGCTLVLAAGAWLAWAHKRRGPIPTPPAPPFDAELMAMFDDLERTAIEAHERAKSQRAHPSNPDPS